MRLSIETERLLELGRRYDKILTARAADHSLEIYDIDFVTEDGKWGVALEHCLIHPEDCDGQCQYSYDQDNIGLHDALGDDCPHESGIYSIRGWSLQSYDGEWNGGLELVDGQA